MYILDQMDPIERLAECCRDSAVWNLDLEETVPLCVWRIYQYIEARDRFVWPKKNSMRFPTVFRHPLTNVG